MSTSPSRSIVFDRIADRYDETRGGNARGRHTAAAFAPWLPPGTVVELGVGTGLIGAALAAAGHPVVGVDLARPMLDRAVERLPGRVIQGDVLAPPFRLGAAAAVVAVHVLHLVGDLAGAVRAAAALLQPGGRLVVSGIDGNRHSDDDIWTIQQDVASRHRLIPNPAAEAVIDIGRDDGLMLIHDGHMPRRKFAQSPDNAADLLESRAWSWCWDLSDDVWTNEVVPAIGALRSLPEPNRQRQGWMEWRYVVLEAAG
jgi:ubiquinone/menaquinone biosynthesis C-methylase UbiE